MTKEEMIQEIEKMSVLELSELVKALEEKFKLLSHDALSNTILALADLKADELIRENKSIHFTKKKKS